MYKKIYGCVTTYFDSKILLLLLFSLILLSFRAAQSSGTDIAHPALWAEDGNIFFQQAKDDGFKSIVQPYAGYIHLFPRVIAVLASNISLSWIPVVFHFAWITIFCFFIYMVYRKIRPINYLVALWGVALVVLQPQAGEIFFCLTNAQWFLGATLFLFVLSSWPEKQSAAGYLFVIVACLTGPFSILAIPFLVLRIIIINDFRKHIVTYALFVALALIQLCILLMSSKPIQFYHPFQKSLTEWLDAVARFLMFGKANALIEISSLLFWAAYPWGSLFNIKSMLLLDRTYMELNFEKIFASLLLVLAFCLMLVGFLRDDLSVISPIISKSGAAAGSRYYFIPYACIILSAIILSRNNLKRLLLSLCFFSIICASTYSKPDRLNMQWNSFVELSKSVQDVIIPVAPRIGSYPGWSVNPAVKINEPKVSPISLDFKSSNVEIINGSIEKDAGIKSFSENGLIIFKILNICKSSSQIGLSVFMTRNTEGWVHVLWGPNNSFNDTNSLLRYYPSGAISALFAFKITEGINSIAIRPSFTTDEVIINKIDVYCLN